MNIIKKLYKFINKLLIVNKNYKNYYILEMILIK